MTLEKYINRLEYIDHLIFQAHTGPATEFAAKLNIGQSQLKAYLRDLRDRGVPIAYSPLRRTYYYTQPGRFYVRFAS